MAEKARPMRAAATRSKGPDADIRDEALDNPQTQDEIRYPKPRKVKLHDGSAIELHTLSSRAQRTFTGFAIRLIGEARRDSGGGAGFSAACAGLLGGGYSREFIPFIIAALHPASEAPAAKQFEDLCAEMDERLASPLGVVDMATIFAQMCEDYDIAKVIEKLPKI